MCRHLAYLGPPIALRGLLFDAPHSLCDQAAHPRHQKPGRVNADGWGVGWYGPDGAIDERYYRTTTAMWDDQFPYVDVVSGAFVAAARLASPGATLDRSGNAPFRSGRWLFSLNGYVRDFNEGVGQELRASVSERRRERIEGDADTAVLFAMVLDRLDAGDQPPDALAGVIEQVVQRTAGKFNLLLSDGQAIHGSRFGNSLFVRDATVASEPLDDGGGWHEIDDGTVFTVTPAFRRDRAAAATFEGRSL